MSKFIFSAALAVLLALTGSAETQSPIKIGVVDMKKMLDSYYKTKEAEQRTNEARKALEKELDERMESYRKALAEEKKLNEEIEDTALSEDAKAKKRNDLDEKTAELKDRERENTKLRTTREKQIKEESERMRTGIVDEINKFVYARVTAEKFDVVLEKSQWPHWKPSPTSSDITDEIIATLNKDKGKEPVPVAPDSSK